MFVVDGNASTYAAVFSKPCRDLLLPDDVIPIQHAPCSVPADTHGHGGIQASADHVAHSAAPPREPPLRSLLLRYAGTKC